MKENELKDPNKIEKSSFKNILSNDFIGLDREKTKLQAYVSMLLVLNLILV
ncbi:MULTISPECIES: hypothetical protein [unclassified Campylobacter]|uniref:hypothetical protein n=1 Tax=unclassified Campylobacter TaxID=2593542 RepID=UPI0016818A85|nr:MULTISPECIES: hypothetical protein [unclassified Campylobacter]